MSRCIHHTTSPFQLSFKTIKLLTTSSIITLSVEVAISMGYFATMKPRTTLCTQCNSSIQLITSELYDGRCAPCSKGKKIKKKSLASNSHDKPRNVFEFIIAITCIVPFCVALLLGGALYSTLQVDNWPIPEAWYRDEIKSIIRQVLWIPIFSILIIVYRFILRSFRLLSEERAKAFPFGLSVSSED